ncbi:TOBE domain-containing protein [Streptomyces sp. NBC_00885]|uniref:TOBE domain-containing protein n=1 Tax=unclassified Streptomyces TaxID=2593676 RepID=UPI002D79BD26|nr:TOBE domain-containing protein [Streptomyces sp.]WSY69847.1 TOBE domain-containing protein [Streptomyces sp. NBC_00885]HET6359628.1 TOBE domain-containing protein [Streptomyces sp.]
MSLSIRNQIPGTVVSVHPGEVMATVKVRLEGGQEITAAITLEAAQELGLAPGSPVRVLVKSTEVSLATAAVEGLSIRNQIPGTVNGITSGGAMASVKVGVVGGELTAAITKDAVTDLGLTAGSSVVALVKSTEISLATD